MEFSGEFTTPVARDRVYTFLTDPTQFGNALPDVQEVTIVDPVTFTARLPVGVSTIRGTVSVRFQRTAETDGLGATYVGKGLGLGSSVEVETSFAVDDIEGGGSRVRWLGKASVFGRVLALAGGLLEPIARKNIVLFTESILKSLSELSEPTTGANELRASGAKEQ